MDNNEKKYNIRITRALPFKSKYGYWSYNIDAKAFDAIQKAQIGGRLVLSSRMETNKETGEEYQAHYFELMTPEQVATIDEYRTNKGFYKKRPKPEAAAAEAAPSTKPDEL